MTDIHKIHWVTEVCKQMISQSGGNLSSIITNIKFSPEFGDRLRMRIELGNKYNVKNQYLRELGINLAHVLRKKYGIHFNIKQVNSAVQDKDVFELLFIPEIDSKEEKEEGRTVLSVIHSLFFFLLQPTTFLFFLLSFLCFMFFIATMIFTH